MKHIVVRAYSAPLYENKVCEKVAVTNCNLTSHACAVRVGWINDGVMRNCTFSNLNITESITGLCMFLPGNPANRRMSDEGFEATHIENISFSNITIDRHYGAPISIRIDNNNLCDAIRNIYFDNIHSFSAQMPTIYGRDNCHVENVYLTNCHFTQVPYKDIPTKYAARMDSLNCPIYPPKFQCVDNLVMINTHFSIL